MTWIVVFTVVNASIFVNPPYNFSVSHVALFNLSPLIFVIIGGVMSGPLNDYIYLYLTRKNRGIYESEFRLVLIIVVVLVGTVGFFSFGATIHYQSPY